MIHADTTHRGSEGAGISIRIAFYPESGGPEVSEVSAATPRAATAKFTRLVLEKAGGYVPEEAVREVVENLIHAEYRGVVISILDDGEVIRVSDKGPGVQDKDRALEFGFSGASIEALDNIRGVGAGLGIARAAAARAGGTLKLEDNIGGGTVTTISVGDPDDTSQAVNQAEEPPETVPPQRKYPDAVPRMNISERQQKVLLIVLEGGEVGPSTVAEELEISVSTAYRDLSVLEEHGLVATEESSKRSISPMGRDLVEAIVASWVR